MYVHISNKCYNYWARHYDLSEIVHDPSISSSEINETSNEKESKYFSDSSASYRIEEE
jgi:hypothetical protein